MPGATITSPRGANGGRLLDRRPDLTLPPSDVGQGVWLPTTETAGWA